MPGQPKGADSASNDLADKDAFRCARRGHGGSSSWRVLLKIFRGATCQKRCVCTCGSIVRRAECPHVYFVAGLQGEMDFGHLPEKWNPGRPKAQVSKKARLGAGGQLGKVPARNRDFARGKTACDA